ncbi:M-phase inducer phosphatase-like [Cylas formicarius]|uniref:M-phase inducer phosphatase-like n=1 Tax=Cylas formicarius TaxID=197179 RepID=UPI002958CF14|nr:M-phase inducer phosphatase-like [Cylas formicarius]
MEYESISETSDGCFPILRSDIDCLSLYESNSRDSGFEELTTFRCSNESDLADDIFQDLPEIGSPKVSKIPTSFSNVISKHIETLKNEKESFAIKKKCFKRFETEEDWRVKRTKLTKNEISPQSSERIKIAVQDSNSHSELIGDFTGNYRLPLTKTRHENLKAVDANTVAKLLRGDYIDEIGSFKIIDCRFPYEYNGGHISGAINLYTFDQCSALLDRAQENFKLKEEKQILIFHCEYSAERGPNMYRFLRNEDRQLNVHTYPGLYFPEIYLLEGGYKRFFDEFSEYCTPYGYMPMISEKHEADFKLFRKISNTFSSDVRNKRTHNFKKIGRLFS